MNDQRFILRDPTAELSPVLRERIAPPASLENCTVGLLSISKERSAEFLDELEKQMAGCGARLSRFEKPTHTKPAPPQLIADLVDNCDVVIEGLAD